VYRLRSASRQINSHEVIESDSEDQHDSKDELVLAPLKKVSGAITTPQRRRSLQHPSQPKLFKPAGYPSPPDSSHSSEIQKTNRVQISKKGVSNFRANLATASLFTPKPAASDDDDEVRVTGTQVNIKYRQPFHSWTLEERKALCLLRRFFSADILSHTAIMNGLFPKALVKFTPNMVNMQYAEIRAGKQCKFDADSAWDYTWYIEDLDLASRMLREDLELLEEIASEVGIALSRRVEEDRRNLIQLERRKEACNNRRPRSIARVETSNTKKHIVRSRQTLAPHLLQISSQVEIRKRTTVPRQSALPYIEHDEPLQRGKSVYLFSRA
jgi:hypothetical protein